MGVAPQTKMKQKTVAELNFANSLVGQSSCLPMEKILEE
jgi:hypothetical protein